MEMNIGDMVAAMAARNEAFRGNEQVPEKVETYNKLKEHAAAIGKVLRAPWYVDDLELREQNTFVYRLPAPGQHPERQHPRADRGNGPAGGHGDARRGPWAAAYDLHGRKGLEGVNKQADVSDRQKLWYSCEKAGIMDTGG